LLASQFYLARPFEDEIKLLRDLVIMPLCSASRGDARFRKALVLDGRIRAIENGAVGKSDIEGKAAMGSGYEQNGPGRLSHPVAFGAN